MKSAWIICAFIIALPVNVRADETSAAEGRQVDTIYMFAGSGGARAYSIDETGANLPQEHAPWRFRRAVSTTGPTFKAGADKEALEEVKKRGYAVAVFPMTIDGKPVGRD